MATIAANRNHADRVNAAYFFRVTAGSFLSPSPPHRLEEIGVRDNSFSTQPGIRRKTRGILRIHYNLALRINRESAHNPGYRAGKAQPARGVQKQQHAFADAVTLAAGPKGDAAVPSIRPASRPTEMTRPAKMIPAALTICGRAIVPGALG